ncbi:MAG TPA: phosphotransferase, partial [Acidimicrobiales bacterium]|nr:phosphotransferase [Acidimicrobiales bacterium]
TTAAAATTATSCEGAHHSRSSPHTSSSEHHEPEPGGPTVTSNPGPEELGREVLTYLPGTTIFHHHVDLLEFDEVLERAGTFVRDLHAVLPRHSDGTVSLHGDLAPWNVVVDGDRWFAIDWDSTHRGQTAWELAYCLMTFCGLWHDRALPPKTAVHRMRRFAAGYGLSDEELADVMRLVGDRCFEVVRYLEQRAAEGIPGFVRLIARGDTIEWRRTGEHAAAQLPAWLEVLSTGRTSGR